MKHYKHIGKQIHRIRKQRGMTQKELAELIGTSKSDISDMENGRKKLSVDRLDNIAIALDAHLNIILMPS